MHFQLRFEALFHFVAVFFPLFGVVFVSYFFQLSCEA